MLYITRRQLTSIHHDCTLAHYVFLTTSITEKDYNIRTTPKVKAHPVVLVFIWRGLAVSLPTSGVFPPGGVSPAWAGGRPLPVPFPVPLSLPLLLLEGQVQDTQVVIGASLHLYHSCREAEKGDGGYMNKVFIVDWMDGVWGFRRFSMYSHQS